MIESIDRSIHQSLVSIITIAIMGSRKPMKKSRLEEICRRSKRAATITERKKLEILEAQDRLTKLSGRYEVCIGNIQNKLKEYQEIVESIDLMIQIVRLEKKDLKEQLMEQNTTIVTNSSLVM